jgi:hypothetical protein
MQRESKSPLRAKRFSMSITHQRIIPTDERQEGRHGSRLRPLQIVGGPGSRRGRPHRCARAREGAHGQLPGGEGAPGQGKLRRNAGEGAAGLSKGSRAGQQRKEGRQEVRGEEGETKEVTLATAFSEESEHDKASPEARAPANPTSSIARASVDSKLCLPF